MKGLICYYSTTGNTKLACEYIRSSVENIKFELFDIIKNDIPDYSNYRVVMFATFTDFGSVPKYFLDYLSKVPSQNNIPAFVFNTYGGVCGCTLKDLGQVIDGIGFNVVSGHSLHTPENYPPLRSIGLGFKNSPNKKDLLKFNSFIKSIDNYVEEIDKNNLLKKTKIKVSFLNSLYKMPRSKAKKDFGEQNVDKSLCINCGQCERLCPSEAIKLAPYPYPVFNHEKCGGCWLCYNKCPQKAIYTKKFRNKEHYPEPSDSLKEKLRIQ